MDVVRYFVRSVEADAAADGTAETAALHERLLAYDGVPAAINATPAELAMTPVLPMHFPQRQYELANVHDHRDVGIPQDITLQELRVECFFPMDDETASVLRGGLAAAPSIASTKRSAAG
jgi:hypothetical protein